MTLLCTTRSQAECEGLREQVESARHELSLARSQLDSTGAQATLLQTQLENSRRAQAALQQSLHDQARSLREQMRASSAAVLSWAHEQRQARVHAQVQQPQQQPQQLQQSGMRMPQTSPASPPPLVQQQQQPHRHDRHVHREEQHEQRQGGNGSSRPAYFDVPDDAALQRLGAQELEELAGKYESLLQRIRAAHVQVREMSREEGACDGSTHGGS